MNASPHSTVEVQQASHEDSTYLRIHTLHRLVIAGVVTGFVWHGYVAGVLEVPSFRPWASPAALVICSLLAYRMLGLCSFGSAACMYVTGTALSVSTAPHYPNATTRTHTGLGTSATWPVGASSPLCASMRRVTTVCES